MRISSAASSFLLLASCTADANTSAKDDGLIDCAVGGAKVFSHDCSVERRMEAGVLQLLVRHPDGGFRRFDVSGEGRGLQSADGAEGATSKDAGDGVEVSIGPDRYRIPARFLDVGK